jgi:hypothetical protein
VRRAACSMRCDPACGPFMVCGLGSVCVTPVPVEAWGVAGPVVAFDTPPLQASGSVAHLLGAVAMVLFLFAMVAMAVIVIAGAVVASPSSLVADDYDYDDNGVGAWPWTDPEAPRPGKPEAVVVVPGPATGAGSRRGAL